MTARRILVPLLTLGALAPVLLMLQGSAPGERHRAPVRSLDVPLAFEPNAGRFANGVDLIARAEGMALAIDGSRSELRLGSGKRPARLVTTFAGGRHSTAHGTDALAGRVNSYLGSDPARWRTGIPTYGHVVVPEVYPGVDVVWHGARGRLEYDVVVAPGANPDRVRLRFDGARSLRVARDGSLLIALDGAPLKQLAPVAYQGSKAVPARWSVRGSVARFELGRYDTSRPLVIDPIIEFSSYLGGTAADQAHAVARGSNGSIYVAGETSSSDFPATNAADSTLSGGTNAFITRIDANGNVIFSTYFGGGSDKAKGITVDANGNAVVGGSTPAAASFPTLHPISGQSCHTPVIGATDGFVARFSAAGALDYSTCIGGDNFDEVAGIAVDASGNPYGVGTSWVGSSQAQDWPTTAGAFGAARFNNFDAVAFKLGFNGSTLSLTYSTFLGGSTGGASASDRGYGIAVDSSGNAYVTGVTESTNFPGSKAIQANNGGGDDAFVAKINATASSLIWSTYLGGSGSESGQGIAVDGNGVYVATDDGSAATVRRLKLDGSAVDYTRGFGGNGIDTAASAVAVDSLGNAYIAGHTDSTNFPVSHGIQTQRKGSRDAIAAKVTASGSVVWATYVGGSAIDDGEGIAVNPSTGEAYVVGTTASSDFPVAGGTPFAGGTSDAFVTVIGLSAPTITSGPSGITGASAPAFAFTLDPSATSAKCAVDGAALATCSSPFTPPPLADGAHVLHVRAVDSGGTVGPDPARAFTVDTQPPSAFEIQTPAEGATVAALRPQLTWAAAADATSGVDHYTVAIDGTPVADVPGSCTASCSTSLAKDLSEGQHTLAVTAVDAAGNSTATPARTFTVAVPPTASFTIAPNPVLVGRSAAFDGSASSDENGTIARYEWDLDGDGTFETDSGSTPSASKTYASAGNVNVGLRVTDAAGNSATAVQVLRVSSSAQPGTQLGVSIEKGAQYTNNPNVTLKVVFPSFTTSILVANDGGFDKAETFMPLGEIRWKLDSSGPERLPKTVYVRFLPSLTNGLTFTDDIILDERPPVVQDASVAPAASGATAARLAKWKVKIKAKDSNSGVGFVQVTAKKSKPGKLIAYKRSLKLKLSAKPKFVRARDRAGNFSPWRKLR